jgi:methyltransferase
MLSRDVRKISRGPCGRKRGAKRWAQPTPAQRMERIVRTYIQACNDADPKAIAECFCSDAVHYFPWRSKWLGAATIGDNFAKVVQEHGVCWTVDQLLTDVDRHAAILEWTRFNRQRDRYVRGVDWFIFEPKTLFIKELRCYSAAPVHPEMAHQELQDFDYGERGYPTAPS